MQVSSAQHGPFDKVKGMVADMLTKLQKEQSEAADHHAFCTEEMGKTKKSLKTKEKEVARRFSPRVPIFTRWEPRNAIRIRVSLDDVLFEYQGERSRSQLLAAVAALTSHKQIDTPKVIASNNTPTLSSSIFEQKLSHEKSTRRR